jgi:hypothetical protein
MVPPPTVVVVEISLSRGLPQLDVVVAVAVVVAVIVVGITGTARTAPRVPFIATPFVDVVVLVAVVVVCDGSDNGTVFITSLDGTDCCVDVGDASDLFFSLFRGPVQEEDDGPSTTDKTLLPTADDDSPSLESDEVTASPLGIVIATAAAAPGTSVVVVVVVLVDVSTSTAAAGLEEEEEDGSVILTRNDTRNFRWNLSSHSER